MGKIDHLDDARSNGFPIFFFEQFSIYGSRRDQGFILNFIKRKVINKILRGDITVLIQKKPGAVELNDFRPINLIGSIH